jgi:hypothetical protein
MVLHGQASAIVGCFFHEDAPIDEARIAGLLGPGPGPRVTVAGRLVWAVREAQAAPGPTVLLGTLGAREAIDRALDGAELGPEALLAKAHDRWGDGAWLRLQGQFAALHYDAEETRLHLLRAPGPASPALYLLREGRRTWFASQLAFLLELEPQRSLDRARLDVWAQTGLWTDPEKSPYLDIEIVPPGTAFVVEAKGRNRRHRFWTFAPMAIPRRLPEADVRRELEAAVAKNIASAGLGPERIVDADPILRPWLVGHEPGPSEAPTLGALLTLAGQAEGPLPKSALERAARLPAGRAVIVDRGAIAGFGASANARAAVLSTLAQALELNPSPRLLAQVIAQGFGARSPELVPELAGVGGRVLDRWRRHLPPELDRRFQWLPAPSAPRVHSPVLTGSPFLDRRFAEMNDRTLEIELALLGRRGPVVAPFADPAVIELLFSVPPEHLCRDGRAYALIGGRSFGALPSLAAEREDRGAGLGIYLAARG